MNEARQNRKACWKIVVVAVDLHKQNEGTLAGGILTLFTVGSYFGTGVVLLAVVRLLSSMMLTTERVQVISLVVLRQREEIVYYYY